MKKENVLLVVKGSISSIFTKEDVINLINSIEESNSNLEKVISKLENLQSTISYNFQNLSSDEVVDYSSVELNINYNNQIEIEDMSLNIDRLNEIVENDIVNLIDELREEEEEEEVEEVVGSEFEDGQVVSSEYAPVEEN